MSGAGPWTEFQGAQPAAMAPAAGAAPAASAPIAASAQPPGPWTEFQTSPAPSGPSANAPAPIPDTWGNAVKFDARALMTGAAGLAGSVGTGYEDMLDLAEGWPAAVAGATPYNGPQLSDFVHPDRWRQAAEYFSNKVGLPAPQTESQKVIASAIGGLPSAILSPEAPIAGLVSGAAGSGASTLVQQQGGTPGEQLAAGLLAGGAPALYSGAAGAVRGLTRGLGQEAADQAGARIADAEAAGTTLTAGQATGSKTLQAVEGTSSKLWGGRPLSNLVHSQDEHVGNTVRQIADNLAGGRDATPTTAGEAINAGAKTAKSNMRAAESAAYDRVATLVSPDTAVNVAGTLDRLNTLATPTPGAEASTGALIPKEISALRDNVASDAGATGTMPYSAVRALRTSVGSHIDWGFAPADPVKNGALKQVYGALTQDLNTAASAASPEAAGAVKAANALHQANVAQSDILDMVVDKAGGPEKVFSAALDGTKTGATKVRAVMGALNPDQQNIFRATIIGKLGLVPASKQGASGEAFKLDSFLTHWNQLSPEAKDALFGASGPANATRRALDSVAKTANVVREGTLFKNPSGTGEAFSHSLSLWDLFEGLGEGAIALHEGFGPAGLAHSGIIAGGATVGNWGLARLLTRPWFARWLATSTKVPFGAVPGVINALQRVSIAHKSQDGLDVAHSLASRYTVASQQSRGRR